MKKVLEVIQIGDRRLRTKSKEVKFPISSADHNLIKDLILLCKKRKGVGIAAPQVGVNKRIFIVWSRPSKRRPDALKMKPLVVINPKIISKSKKMIKDFEGCLSIPNLRAKVSRHQKIEVEFYDVDSRKIRHGGFSGLLARIFQHEFDHLEGILFIDRVSSKDLVSESEFKKIVNRKR